VEIVVAFYLALIVESYLDFVVVVVASFGLILEK